MSIRHRLDEALIQLARAAESVALAHTDPAQLIVAGECAENACALIHEAITAVPELDA